MRYLVVGLGSFGASLSKELTAHGHEVIGIDTDMQKVEHFKESISHTIRMDATDEFAVSGLPLRDTDVVIVAIGEEQGVNIMATALFKNLGVKRLVSRSINALHEKVLQAIGVDEIVRPEAESAERWAKKFTMKNVVDSFELGEDYSIVEAEVSPEHVGKTIEEVGFRRKHHLLVLSILNQSKPTGFADRNRKKTVVRGVVTPQQILAEDDVLVLYGSNKDLQSFLKRQIA